MSKDQHQQGVSRGTARPDDNHNEPGICTCVDVKNCGLLSSDLDGHVEMVLSTGGHDFQGRWYQP